jgi:hypothetical protein
MLLQTEEVLCRQAKATPSHLLPKACKKKGGKAMKLAQRKKSCPNRKIN